MDNNKIIERIRALLALAKSDNENEAMAAARQAMRLMEKHRVSEAAVQCAQKNAGEEPIVRDVIFVTEGKKVAWKIQLANALANNNACKAWTAVVRIGDSVSHRQVIVGSKEDIAVVQALFSWTSLAAERLAKAGVRKRPSYIPSQKWRTDFLFGFAVGIGQQLREAKAEVRKDVVASSGTALVLLKHEERVIAVYKAIPGMKTLNLGPRLISSGFGEGREAGKKLHLGKSLAGLD